MAAIVAVSRAVVIPGAGLVASAAYPAAYPGAYPAAYPGAYSGAYPGAYPGVARLASPLGYPAVAKAVVAKVGGPIDDYDPNPQYSYSYDIHVRMTSLQQICFLLYKFISNA